MKVITGIIAGLGALALTIGLVDGSARAAACGVALGAAAYAMHRRFRAFWWLGCLVLLLSLVQSAAHVLRAAQTPLALMCSILGMLFAALAASWWWRQRQQFARGRGTAVNSCDG